MNLINPQLLLSAQVASLVLLASIFASVIVWLCCRRSSPGPQPIPHAQIAGEAAGTRSEELRRHLAATENQCVEALEQRDEADRQALLRAGELRKLQEEHAQCLQKLAQAEALTSVQQTQIDKLNEALHDS